MGEVDRIIELVQERDALRRKVEELAEEIKPLRYLAETDSDASAFLSHSKRKIAEICQLEGIDLVHERARYGCSWTDIHFGDLIHVLDRHIKRIKGEYKTPAHPEVPTSRGGCLIWIVIPILFAIF